MKPLDISTLHFLVVDDNVYMRRIIRMLLNSYGARYIADADDGATALEKFESENPDIVITDWSMPVFDGIELTKMLRNENSSSNPYVPIIMMTGHSMKTKIIEARNAGVTEFLCKPISAKDLYMRIVNIIGNPRNFVKSNNYFGPDRRRVNNGNSKGQNRRESDIGDVKKTS
jgi:two-component system chemotaxis response regulator CheY